MSYTIWTCVQAWQHRNNGHSDIVAKFTLFKDIDVVRQFLTYLKRTGHYINEHYSRTIAVTGYG